MRWSWLELNGTIEWVAHSTQILSEWSTTGDELRVNNGFRLRKENSRDHPRASPWPGVLEGQQFRNSHVTEDRPIRSSLPACWHHPVYGVLKERIIRSHFLDPQIISGSRIFQSLHLHLFLYIFFFLSFCLFRAAPTAYGGSQARGQIRATPQPQQHQIRAESVTHITAHGNVRSFTHWTRPGIEPTNSWFLIGFISAVPQRKLPSFTHWLLLYPTDKFIFA